MALKTESDPSWRPYHIQRDPNECFVLFSPTHLNASSVSISLQGLLNQVNKMPADRAVKSVEYLPIGQKLLITFEDQADPPSEGE